MNDIRRAETSYYLSLCVLTVAKTLPHAVLTVLLFAKGLSLPQILFIQAVFNAVVLFAEFPSGVISDLYGRKAVFLAANIAMMAMCLLVLNTRGFVFMAIAWGLYGLSEALESGTLDASLVNFYKRDAQNPTEAVTRFKKLSNQLELVSMILGATLGSALYLRIGSNMYALSLALVCLSTAVIALRFPRDPHAAADARPSVIGQIRGGWNEMARDRRLKYLILLSAVSQVFFTMHYNLWQAYVLKIGVAEHSLIWFYLVFQVIGIAAFQIPIRRVGRVALASGGLVSALVPVFILSGNIWGSIVAYCVSVLCFSFLQYLYDVLFSLYISQERISTMITANSTISRIAGFATLAVSGLLVPVVDLKPLLVVSFEVAVVGSLALIALFIRRSRAEGRGTARNGR